MATATAKKRGSQTEAITYDDLYRRWEEGNWKATDIDFSEDRKGWEGLMDIQRKSALWTYSMFFYGEDSVTDNLSPYIDAAPKEEQSTSSPPSRWTRRATPSSSTASSGR